MDKTIGIVVFIVGALNILLLALQSGSVLEGSAAKWLAVATNALSALAIYLAKGLPSGKEED